MKRGRGRGPRIMWSGRGRRPRIKRLGRDRGPIIIRRHNKVSERRALVGGRFYSVGRARAPWGGGLRATGGARTRGDRAEDSGR